ncbi:uncharacterized protein znf654 isoform X3 [Misgurnus anguillicaudatus]|uniref:uncharacterized protein znf654 isoform X3 n=1 Tax=Misgurnus anguillicaudatus TaxID=75329 RepID=UPI002435FCF0|nr:zinc finger protein 654 isoform X3 [Misgurnus anguillicaudatus]
MAEEDSELELHTFMKELDSLLNSSARDERGLQSKTYCERFCKLVLEQTGRWQVPLPQLQLLRSALCSFVQGAAFFPPECEHVRYTLSSLALSVFELLLFFGRDEFIEHPLKDILDSFQMANIDGKGVVEILCIMEGEERDEMVLMLSKGFLYQQLQNGDMYCLWDLVFMWSRLYLRVNHFKQGFLDECKQMILSATNIKAIFPFIKVILEELGQDGLGFCVELCALALQTDLKNDPVTKSILYKTIAYLLPNDLEICRACALLVFFLERTVESYKTVFLLYKHPDQEYHADTSPVGNNVRFEVLQILKKGLFFDPEFWSLLNIETHCLKLLRDKAALCEIMQKDKWAQNYCMKGHCHCHTDDTTRTISHVEKHTNRNDQKVESVKTLDNTAFCETSSKTPGKKRGRKPGTRLVKDPDASPVRRSFRQIDMAKDHARQHKNRHQRFLARQAKNPNLKRRGRKPWWLLDELAARAENGVTQQGTKPGRKPKQSDVLKEISVDAPVSEITLTLSYPDNEVILSSDIQTSLFATETPHVTEQSTNKTKSASREILKRSSVNSNSVIKLRSVETLPCRKKDFIVTEEVFFQDQGLSMVRQFHTYSKVTEFEETTVDSLPRDEEVKPDYMETKKKRHLQTAEQPSETEIPEGATQISVYSSVKIHVTPIPTINSVTSMPVLASIEPTEEFTVEAKSNPDVLKPQTAETKCPDITVSPPGISNVRTPEVSTSISADSIRVSYSMPENMTGFHENAPAVLPELTRVPYDVVAALSETDVFSEVVSKDTTMFEVPAGPHLPEMLENVCTDSLVPDLISTNVDSQRVLLKCSLCDKETKYQYILRHAMWHYRIDRKCMFCHKCYTHGRSPSVHFKLHIQELKESNVRFKENIEVPEAPKQTVLKRVNCSVQNKFRHIKMRLNSSLNIADLHEKGHSSKSKVRLRTRVAKNSELTSTLEEREGKVCRKKRHLRKVLARSQSTDENKKMRLARKRAKTMQASEENRSDTKGNLQAKSTTRRLNGVIRKRKVKSAQEEKNMEKKAQKSITKDNRQEKMEFVKKAETNATSDDVTVSAESVNVELDRKDIIGSELQGNYETMLNSGLAKITHRYQKEDVVAVKQKLVQIGPKEVSENQEHKEKTSSAKEINKIVGHKNGTQTKPKLHSTIFQGKRTGASTQVKCPVEICTFSAKSVLVLSHVLLHHHGDKKALVFFYHFGKEKCLFCGRKVCNPQHFFDHVICHKGELKHPCYHQGCKQRFQTRVELGEHMLGHHQLRAMCCFPGCSLHLDSILHLYKHEKTHYKFDENLEQTSLSKKVEQMVLKAPPSRKDVLESATNSSTGHLVYDTPKHKDLGNRDDDSKPWILNKGSLSYSSKNHSLINGHREGDKDAPSKTSDTAVKEQERLVSVKPTTKRFIRPPPSAYLDESYISMPKRWKEPQVGSKLLGAVSSEVSNANRQRCPRCFQSFNSEEEFQTHKDKCTSLFGFDSDDESAS